MTTSALTVTDFVLARIAEDEAAARAVLDHFYGEGRWTWNVHMPPPVKVALVDERGVHMVQTKGDGPTWMVSDHIARHNPARVLAQCAAMRKVLMAANVLGLDVEAAFALILAPIWAHHPDFNPGWPTGGTTKAPPTREG